MNDAGKINLAWQNVEKSRHAQRPHSIDYLRRLFLEFEEFKGDRKFSDDPAIITGVGILTPENESNFEEKVFFIAHEKGRSAKEKSHRNFGLARPEGYRKACRIFDLAERFKKPVLTLIDTVGAFPGLEAEARGQAEAIASCIQKMFLVPVPTVSVVIGEGGSGGALAIGVADRLLMMENSTYSVISPESCAAILWGHSGEAKQAAYALKLGAAQVKEMGICDEIVKEGGEGAHESLELSGDNLSKAIMKNFRELKELSTEDLQDRRFKKYRYIDQKMPSAVQES